MRFMFVKCIRIRCDKWLKFLLAANFLRGHHRDMFIEIDLRDSSLVGDFRVMYDNDARYIYFHLLD